MFTHIDSIVAIATPPGHGGVGIVRLSGSAALEIAKKMCPEVSFKPRYSHFAKCLDETLQMIDEGVVIYFKAPYSYTGEDIIEFQMHGSPWVLGEILRLCQVYGARMARPGEFTERAFLNNKIDLVQAEAVADLINAQSVTAAKMAARTLQGKFSEYVHAIDEELTALRMYVESTIDFSDEALEWLEQYKWQERLDNILKKVIKLKFQAHQGQLLQDGLCIVLAGRPNVGKSTLMNVFAKKDIAIVTDIAGTTRDVMKEKVLLDDIPITLIDTAGLRVSDDIIEQEGIRRAWDTMKHADLVLFIHDAAELNWRHDDLPLELKEKLPQDIPVLHVLNKIDVMNQKKLQQDNVIYISAKQGIGLSELIKSIKSIVGIQREESDFIARKRHVLIFSEVEKNILHAIEQFKIHQAPELLAEDLRVTHELLGEITGEFSADDLLGEIFSNFCIGK